MKRRRMPYVAKIKRQDPFRPADSREIEAMVKRIAAAGGDVLHRRLARGRGLPAVPRPDLGKGPRAAALDRPQRHRSAADADALQRAAAWRWEWCVDSGGGRMLGEEIGWRREQ